MAYERRIYNIETFHGTAFVNIKVALATWLQKHSFDAEYTISCQLTTNMLKMAFMEKKLVMRYLA